MTIHASCHCRATQFTVPSRPESVTRCTCSFCSKRGALWAYYGDDEVILTTSRDRVSTYQFGRFAIEHHYCAICGCGTFSRSPVWDTALMRAVPGKFKMQINAWLLDDFDLDAQPVKVVDGKNLW